MRPLISSLFPLLNHATNTLAAPFSLELPSSLNLVQTGSISQGTNSSHPLQDILSSFPTFCDHQNLLRDTEQYTFHVPDTDTYLNIFYCPDLLMDGIAIHNTLSSTYDVIMAHIDAHGGGDPLPTYDSPRVAGENCSFGLEPWTNPQTGVVSHMTYQVAKNVVEAYADFLVDSDRYGSAVAQVIDLGLTPGRDEPSGLASIRPYGD
ncbi:hypothetical protein MMC28_003803 [Mycoblastus sanguinarius]|nr:hypothetical protein [Mycoblastus sanguinarius]